jgi:hypothetical protein
MCPRAFCENNSDASEGSNFVHIFIDIFRIESINKSDILINLSLWQ